MIEPTFFTYTDAQWRAVKTVIRDRLGADADQIKRPVTFKTLEPAFLAGIPADLFVQPLRHQIEHVVSMYFFFSAVSRQRPRRKELDTLRENIENLRTSIIAALTLPLGTKYDFAPHPMRLDGVDDDMPNATRDYFSKLMRNLDRMSEQAGSRRHNARKPDRDKCWSELLAIWCDLGGEPRGEEAAKFIRAASLPVMGSAVPTLASIVQWLERRQNKTAKTAKPVLRRAIR